MRKKNNPPVEPITEAERSGSITGIGVVLGFSLAFMGQWSLVPGSWQKSQLAALSIAMLGVSGQLIALINMLRLPLVSAARHKKVITLFTWGVSFVLCGFGLHVFLDYLASSGN